MKTTSDN